MKGTLGSWFGPKYVTHYQLRTVVEHFNERLEQMAATEAENQAQIDAAATAVAGVESTLEEIDAAVKILQAAAAGGTPGQSLDFGPLMAIISTAGGQATTDLADAAPVVPPPPPAPAPAPADPAPAPADVPVADPGPNAPTGG